MSGLTILTEFPFCSLVLMRTVLLKSSLVILVGPALICSFSSVFMAWAHRLLRVSLHMYSTLFDGVAKPVLFHERLDLWHVRICPSKELSLWNTHW